MTTGRTVDKWTRVYHDGYDISGYSRSVGPCGVVYDEADLTVLLDQVKGYQANRGQMNAEVVNGVLENTASVGLHIVGQAAGQKRTLLIAFGILGEPAMGDPCFGGQFTQAAYQTKSEGGAVVATLPYMGWAADATFFQFARPFGFLLAPKAARTAANSSTGVDDNAAASAAGSWMLYQIFGGDGTATIKSQDAATNADGSFADITGLTTGVLDCTSPKHVIVKATTSTLRRYTRWQLALGTATTVTFALALWRA